MECIKYHGIAMGGKIYSLRMAKRMSQEQLATVLSISPAAISKWERKLYSNNTNLLEDFVQVGDFEIQSILRNLDEATLTGASGKVIQRFLKNLADRVLYFIHEDMEHWSGTEEDILAAQKKILELGNIISA